MCKTGHKHAANENTHKPHVHTRHDNMKARSQWNTQAACHTAQDITWMHAANKNTNCVQHHKTHLQRRARGRANSKPHTHTTRQNTKREVSQPHHETQHETRHADERAHSSSTLEAAHSHKNRTWRECQGSVTKPMKTEVTEPWQKQNTKQNKT